MLGLPGNASRADSQHVGSPQVTHRVQTVQHVGSLLVILLCVIIQIVIVWSENMFERSKTGDTWYCFLFPPRVDSGDSIIIFPVTVLNSLTSIAVLVYLLLNK